MKVVIITGIVYLTAFASMVWIDWRLMIPFMLFGWASNLERKGKSN